MFKLAVAFIPFVTFEPTHNINAAIILVILKISIKQLVKACWIAHENLPDTSRRSACFPSDPRTCIWSVKKQRRALQVACHDIATNLRSNNDL